MINKILKKIKKVIRHDFQNEKTGHDLMHLKRVLSFAKKIQKKEGGDKDVILISALVHDVHRTIPNPTPHQTEHGVTASQSLFKVKEILTSCDIPDDIVMKVLEVVKYHDDFTNKNLNLETRIMQDADRLDAIGKNGLKRTLAYCKYKNIPIFDASYPLDTKSYVPGLNPISTCHYVYRTMIPHKDNLHTQTARNMIKKDIKVLEEFVENNSS